MATLEDNIKQAISDFNDIEAAIEEQGVDVPEGTDTSEYGKLIRSIPTSGNSPIKYVESVDSENPLYLRDLESGTYILYGRFIPYNGSTNTCTFSTGMLVSVIRNTSISYIQIFYSKDNTIQYCEITDDTYERKDANLINMESTANLTTTIDANSDDTHYPSAKAVFGVVSALETALRTYIEKTANKDCSNAIKEFVSGEVIRVDDVSPIEHTAKAKVAGKNLWTVGNLTANNIAYDKETQIMTISGAANTTLYTLPTPIPKGTVVTITATVISGVVTSNADGGLAFGGYNKPASGGTTWQGYINVPKCTEADISGRVFTQTAETTADVTHFYAFVYASTATIHEPLQVQIQYEIGDTATEYEPYIDPTTVTVTRCGKNLLPSIATTQEGNGITYTVNADGSVTCNGTATKNAVINLTENYKLPIGRYILRGCPSTGSDTTYRLQTNKIINGEVSTGCVDVGSGARLNITQECQVYSYIVVLKDATVSNVTFYPQLQLESDTDTTYEQYNGETYTPDANGTVEISSISPCMMLLTNTAGTNIEVEYNQDSNAFKDNVTADLQALDDVTAKLTNKMGDVETALDNIIAIQNSLIGGGSE